MLLYTMISQMEVLPYLLFQLTYLMEVLWHNFNIDTALMEWSREWNPHFILYPHSITYSILYSIPYS